jgi:NAD(P)-dependent dehydrogenase (short-subunit alcohol dehydrogenase family)
MPALQFNIDARVALVTGGASGIGRAIASGLAGTGLSVAVVDKDAPALAAVVEALHAAGGRAKAIFADVSKAADVERAVREASAEYGAVDVLVNCAGIFPRSFVVEMDEAEWDRVMATNAKSLFLGAKAVLPSMLARKAGHIMSITSGLAAAGARHGAHYAASKAAINAFTRSLAKEVAEDGIRVNTIAPGLTDTPMMRAANPPEYIAAFAKSMIGGRLGRPEDVVSLVLFLISDAGRHVTGQIISVRE